MAVKPEDYLGGKAVDGLPLEDGAFEAAVAAQVLCSMPSQAAALQGLHRLVRPGGKLRFRSRDTGRAIDVGAARWP